MSTKRRFLQYYAYLCNINNISYQEITIFAKQIPSKFCGYKSFKIRLLALSTTFVSSDAR